MSLSRLILLLPFASTCFAVQITLSPANVIGGSGSYGPNAWNAGGFNATQILDQQTGPVNDIFATNYWLNPDNGPANAYIVIDLGAAFQITSLDLFNTHNANFNDRGTGSFSFEASNSVTNLGANGFDLSGSITNILNGVLAAGTTNPDPAQSFAVSNTNSFRYIKFEPHTVAASGTPCCGTNVYGLTEVRVFGSNVPEPSSMALLGSGLLAGLATLTRRRRR
jgi:hypothetical protein